MNDGIEGKTVTQKGSFALIDDRLIELISNYDQFIERIHNNNQRLLNKLKEIGVADITELLDRKEEQAISTDTALGAVNKKIDILFDRGAYLNDELRDTESLLTSLGTL